MELSTEGRSFDSIGGHRAPVGWYHVALYQVDESLKREPPAIMMIFQILAGTTPNQRGAMHVEYFNLSPKDGSEGKRKYLEDRLLKVAMALELIRENERRDVVFGTALGRQLIVEIAENTWKDAEGNPKKGLGIGESGFAFYPVTHPSVGHVPKCKESLALLGSPATTAGVAATPAATATPAASPAAAPAPAASQDDKWKGL